MDLETAWRLIQTDPRTLLNAAFVAVAGGGPSSKSRVSLFVISKATDLDGTVTRTDGAVVPVFRVELRQDDQILPPKFTQGTVEFRSFPAFYIAMKQMGDGPGDAPQGTYYTLPATGGGSDLCVTSQLSGCTFGIGSQADDGCCLVSHIQPKGPLALAQPIMAQQTQALFGQAPDTLVERGVGYTDRAHILGHRLYGRWSFFIQKFRSQLPRVMEPVADL